MDKTTAYEKPTCTTCRKVAKAISEQGIYFEKVNYIYRAIQKKTKRYISKIENEAF